MPRPCSAWLLIAALAGASCITGAAAAPLVVRSRIVTESTIIPGKSVPFRFLSGNRCCGHYQAPAISAGNVVFWGSQGAGNPPEQQGMYVLRYGVLGKVSDDLSTIPGVVGAFREYNGRPSISGGNVAFAGYDQAFQPRNVAAGPEPVWPPGPIKIGDGKYIQISGRNLSFDDAAALYVSVIINPNPQPGPYVPATPITLVDASTTMPGGGGNFEHWSDEMIVGTDIAFAGYRDGTAGFYLRRLFGGPLVKVVDTHTPIPGGSGTFQNMNLFSFDGAHLAFVGHGANLHGVYSVALPSNLGAIPAPVKIADTTTLVPGTNTTFRGMGFVSVDRGYVVFEGYSEQNGVQVDGLYTNVTGTLAKLVDTNDLIDGRKLDFITFGPSGFSGTEAVFAADFADFSTAIVSAKVTGNTCARFAAFWSKRPASWPAEHLFLGNERYSKEEAQSLLNPRSPASDLSLALARQLIAAKLNVLNLASSRRADAAIAKADGLLAKHAGKLPYGVDAKDSAGQAMLAATAALVQYNAGLFGLRNCLVVKGG